MTHPGAAGQQGSFARADKFLPTSRALGFQPDSSWSDPAVSGQFVPGSALHVASATRPHHRHTPRVELHLPSTGSGFSICTSHYGHARSRPALRNVVSSACLHAITISPWHPPTTCLQSSSTAPLSLQPWPSQTTRLQCPTLGSPRPRPPAPAPRATTPPSPSSPPCPSRQRAPFLPASKSIVSLTPAALHHRLPPADAPTDLKRELMSQQTQFEISELSSPTALQRFGAPFRSDAGEVAPEDSELPILRYIFVHHVRNFPFLDKAKEKEFWQDKLQVVRSAVTTW